MMNTYNAKIDGGECGEEQFEAKSAKEALVLGASAGGASTEEIAAAVSLSEGTVRNYLSSAIGKLGARNRAEALRVATDNGWV